MPIKPEIYGAHTPSNSTQNINTPEPKFANLPPSPPPLENVWDCEIPPQTTDIPPRTTNPSKSSKFIRLIAHEPKGTEQQEWDSVLEN